MSYSVKQTLTIPIPAGTTYAAALTFLIGKILVNTRNGKMAKILTTGPGVISDDVKLHVSFSPTVLTNLSQSYRMLPEDLVAGDTVYVSPGAQPPLVIASYTDINSIAINTWSGSPFDFEGVMTTTTRKISVGLDSVIYTQSVFPGSVIAAGASIIYGSFNASLFAPGDRVAMKQGLLWYKFTVVSATAFHINVVETGPLGGLNSTLTLIDDFAWRVVNMPTSLRIFDYKIKPDNQNYFFFPLSAEWVVYHTLTNASFYGGQFYPWVGSVQCYDENDNQIYPSDIIFYPEVVNNGIYESAKVVIKWTWDSTYKYGNPTGMQSGKVCFNQGYSQNEAGDQSRIIMNAVASDFSIQPDGTYQIQLQPLYSARASAIVTTEPYQTVDVVGNGRTCSAALSYNGGGSAFERMSRIRLRSDSLFYKNIDSLISGFTGNPDILYSITISSTTLTDLMSDPSWLALQNSVYRAASDTPWYVNVSDLPINTVDAKLGLTKLFIDNIGYYFDEAAATYNLVLYCHGKGSSSYQWIPSGSKNMAQMTAAGLVSVAVGEPWRPMIKIGLAGGYVKMVRRDTAYGEITTAAGELEREYIVEIPFATSMHTQIRSAGTNKFTNSPTPTFFETQIVHPISYLKEGAVNEEASQRQRLVGSKLFTKIVFAASDHDVPVQTYDRSSGGGVYDALVRPSQGDLLTYPNLSVFREVIPQSLASCSDGTILINVLSGSDGSHTVIAPNFEAKVFVLYDNRKWKFNTDQYDSVNCGPYPAWVFEMDATALLQRLDTTTHPGLPDIKRWFRGYCRGFGLTRDGNGVRIPASASGSELVMEIWDNESAVSATFECNVTITGTVVTNLDFMRDGSNAFSDSMFHSGITIFTVGVANHTCAGVTDNSHMSITTPVVGTVSGLLRLTAQTLTKPNWRSLTPSQYDVEVDSSRGYISEDRTFPFGGEVVVSNTQIQSYLDLKRSQADVNTGVVATALQRYIDSNNKVRFRARLQTPSAVMNGMTVEAMNPAKTSTDRDSLSYMPWTAGVEVDPVLQQETISDVGLNYFKIESL